MKRNIIITGERGAGKSTLVRRLLPLFSDMEVRGFITLKEDADANGEKWIYIHPAQAKERVYTDANCVGECHNRKWKAFPGIFESEGIRVLEDIPPEALVVMDEIGFFEEPATAFLWRLKALFDGPNTVIAVVKAKPTAYLDSLRAMENAEHVVLTPETREAEYERLKALILASRG